MLRQWLSEKGETALIWLLSDAAGLWEPTVRPLQLVHLCCHNAYLQALGFPYHRGAHGNGEAVLQQLPWYVQTHARHIQLLLHPCGTKTNLVGCHAIQFLKNFKFFSLKFWPVHAHMQMQCLLLVSGCFFIFFTAWRQFTFDSSHVW